ncbi:hypothetical protein cgR_0606 [Corynebacterium glutamicum R]|uniref:Uncharacterized protein n=1 Tax=Corynebacterium glutamicum (strain R) TaxID=340322 RepID=A0AB72V8K2_CORGB|nr:hypothetical protein cgR_0606 [Corynebacterium glutamicum R]
MCSLVTVAGTLASEAMALHSAGVALTLGGTGDVNELDVVEDFNGNVLSNLVTGDIVHTNLGDVAAGGNACFLEVTSQWLVHLAWVDFAVGDLDGVVAIGLNGANLGNYAWTRFNDGNRNNAVLLVEDLSHAELGAQNALDLVFTHYLFSAAKNSVDH